MMRLTVQPRKPGASSWAAVATDTQSPSKVIGRYRIQGYVQLQVLLERLDAVVVMSDEIRIELLRADWDEPRISVRWPA